MLFVVLDLSCLIVEQKYLQTNRNDEVLNGKSVFSVCMNLCKGFEKYS